MILIGLSTLGVLMPPPETVIVKEQFSSLDAELDDATAIQVEMVDMGVELDVVMTEPEEMTVEVEVLETVSGQVADDSLIVTLE